MDWAHIHIMINHFPVVLSAVGTVAALMGLILRRRGPWLYAAVSLTLAGVTVIPTYFTGDLAKDFLNKPWFVAPGVIHQHEDAALIAAVLLALAGVAGAVAWRRLARYPRELSLPVWLRTIMLVTALAGSASVGYTALLGGRIVHDAPVLRGPRPAGLPDSSTVGR
jgi:uncharacterized membrane protein